MLLKSKILTLLFKIFDFNKPSKTLYLLTNQFLYLLRVPCPLFTFLYFFIWGGIFFYYQNYPAPLKTFCFFDLHLPCILCSAKDTKVFMVTNSSCEERIQKFLLLCFSGVSGVSSIKHNQKQSFFPYLKKSLQSF